MPQQGSSGEGPQHTFSVKIRKLYMIVIDFSLVSTLQSCKSVSFSCTLQIMASADAKTGSLCKEPDIQ